MVAVPKLMPVTRPELLTVATDSLLDDHAPELAGVPVPVSCVVEPMQADNVPVMVGSSLMETKRVA